MFIALKIASLAPRERVTVARQADRRGHYLLERELAIVLLGENHARDRAGHANRFVSNLAGAGDHISLRIQIHIYLRRSRSLFAVIEKMGLAVYHPDQHESATAQ